MYNLVFYNMCTPMDIIVNISITPFLIPFRIPSLNLLPFGRLFPPPPKQPLICFLSLKIGLPFLESYVNGILYIYSLCGFFQSNYFEIDPCCVYQ